MSKSNKYSDKAGTDHTDNVEYVPQVPSAPSFSSLSILLIPLVFLAVAGLVKMVAFFNYSPASFVIAAIMVVIPGIVAMQYMMLLKACKEPLQMVRIKIDK